jgi:hypothetical protein
MGAEQSNAGGSPGDKKKQVFQKQKQKLIFTIFLNLSLSLNLSG